MNTKNVYQPPGPPWPKVLYQDKDILIVEKPSGLLSNPGRSEHLQDSVQHRLEQQFPLLYLIHRLDMATSGLMIFALRRKAESALKQQFANRSIDKTYVARVAGIPANSAGCIDAALAPVADLPADSAPRHQICLNGGKPAMTFYRTLWQDAESALLQLKPITGRSHQLRVHLQHLGHPILGDAIYATAAQQTAAARLLLHAMTLAFNHPFSGERMEFNCPPDLQAFGLAEMPPLYSTAQMLNC